MREEIGEFLITRIKGEARRGKPLNGLRWFPPLAPSTKMIREALSGVNETHPAFKYDRSNLTFSGQLIDAVVFELTDDHIKIFVDRTRRRPLRGVSFGRGDFKAIGEAVRSAGGNQFATTAIVKNVRDQKNNKTNTEIDKDLRKRGFILFNKAGIESEPRVMLRINNIVKKFVRRAIKVNFEN